MKVFVAALLLAGCASDSNSNSDSFVGTWTVPDSDPDTFLKGATFSFSNVADGQLAISRDPLFSNTVGLPTPCDASEFSVAGTVATAHEADSCEYTRERSGGNLTYLVDWGHYTMTLDGTMLQIAADWTETAEGSSPYSVEHGAIAVKQ